jgi:hypothetical protein
MPNVPQLQVDISEENPGSALIHSELERLFQSTQLGPPYGGYSNRVTPSKAGKLMVD